MYPYLCKGEPISIQAVTGHFCPACDEIVLDRESGDRYGELIRAFQQQVNAAYVDLVFIIKVRKKPAANQRVAAKIFGEGINAFSRYESTKKKPPLALIRLSKVLDRPPNLLAKIRAWQPKQSTNNMETPQNQIRALFDHKTIRVYQAYSNDIAQAALEKQTFVSPPFNRERMTWIKPSFLWMMYRAGWGFKDLNQQRILAIDISHIGFAWALQNACETHPPAGMTNHDWKRLKHTTPVRIQWDPERDLNHLPLTHRSIQIGLSGPAVDLYIDHWIAKITDVTALAHSIKLLVDSGDSVGASNILPAEKAYEVRL